MKTFLKKYKWYILIIILLCVIFYPKSNGYKIYNDQGGYKEEACSCLGYNNRFSFFSQTHYTCFGIPLSCEYNEKLPFQP